MQKYFLMVQFQSLILELLQIFFINFYVLNFFAKRKIGLKSKETILQKKNRKNIYRTFRPAAILS